MPLLLYMEEVEALQGVGQAPRPAEGCWLSLDSTQADCSAIAPALHV